MKVYPDKTMFGWDGDNGVGEMLIQQIVDGTKTATCFFRDECTAEDLEEIYGTGGKYVTVLDHRGNPRCNIRIIEVFETTFGNPDQRLVAGEGDGDDARKFQEDHRDAWNATMPGVALTAETMLIVQLFELVEA